MFVWGNAKDEKLTALVIADEMGRGEEKGKVAMAAVDTPMIHNIAVH